MNKTFLLTTCMLWRGKEKIVGQDQETDTKQGSSIMSKRGALFICAVLALSVGAIAVGVDVQAILELLGIAT